MNFARSLILISLSIGTFAVGCASPEKGAVANDEGALTANGGSNLQGPRKEDSISCTFDGLTIAARLGEQPGAVLEVKGVLGTRDGLYPIDTTTGGFSYSKLPGDLSERVVIFGSDRKGAWAVLDVTSNGDEDSVTATIALPDQPVVTKQVNGGDYWCTFGVQDPAARRAKTGR